MDYLLLRLRIAINGLGLWILINGPWISTNGLWIWIRTLDFV